MPTYTDCNTPQAVIDLVDGKIENGCKFIGYLCGHTHQDDIWDAESNGAQLMYCITCATVAEHQNASDQYRGEDADAFNLVTIDTVHKQVKIVRGGGANMDILMRNRKWISFNYENGTVIGEDK